MKLQLFLLADFINMADGKLNIIGEFDTIWSDNFPVRHHLMCIVAKISFDSDDFGRNKTIKLLLIDEEGIELMKSEREYYVPQPNSDSPHMYTHVFNFVGAVFKHSAQHQFNLYVDEDLLGSIPLNVVLRETTTYKD